MCLRQGLASSVIEGEISNACRLDTAIAIIIALVVAGQTGCAVSARYWRRLLSPAQQCMYGMSSEHRIAFEVMHMLLHAHF